MRRSRFAKTTETADTARERASIRETLWFDIHSTENSGEASLAEWRVAGLDHIALLMGFTHILMTVGYVLLSSTLQFCFCFDNPLIPSTLVIALDAVAAAALIMRKRWDIAAHTM